GAEASVKTVSVDASPSREAGAKAAAPPAEIAGRAVFVRHELPPEVRPAVPIRGREAASGNADTTEPQAAAPSASNPPLPDPSTPVPQSPVTVPVYLSPAPVSAPPPQRQEQ